MFTGIIKHLGEIRAVRSEGTNRVFDMFTSFDEAIHVDQSISHDGVCLTVESILEEQDGGTLYSLTAVEETLTKTSLEQWELGRVVNVELCLQAGARLDGHFVQGHVDTTGTVRRVELRDGSWLFEFRFDPKHRNLVVDRGSICVNGVSLTVVDAMEDGFTVTIIPFTYEHTSFRSLKEGDTVNLEFDILGKYMLRIMESRLVS
ncbi:MAG: riboflavin synthase [Bacteroidota bacterium]